MKMGKTEDERGQEDNARKAGPSYEKKWDGCGAEKAFLSNRALQTDNERVS